MRLRAQAYHVHRTCTRIKLMDVATDKAMHSHEVRPPVSDVGFQDEVSAYGMTAFAGGINNDWTVEIERATGATENRASARGR
jgi:dolichyl-phosphate-mannose--protein O-mannosyl transferase